MRRCFIWAGLIALANQQNGKSAGFIQPAIYAAKAKSAFRDITQGTNYVGSPVGFKAGTGWDACTGLGSPIAPQLMNIVSPSASTTKPKSRTKKSGPAVRRSR